MSDAGKSKFLSVISRNGGQTWSKKDDKTDLPVPDCQGSILNWTPKPGRKTYLIHSNPVGPKRTHMTISLSKNKGKSWKTSRLLHAGPSAYSDLAVLPDGTIGCLYEGGEKFCYATITFARFSLDWIEGD